MLDVNRRACESLGYAREELIGMSPTDFDPDVTPARVAEILRELKGAETVAFETRHRRKDGTIFPVEIRSRPFSERNRQFIVSLGRDTTERKQAEEALRVSEERFRTLAKATNDAVWDWDLATNKVWWSEGVLKLFGHRLETNEADPSWWIELIHPDDRAAVEAFFFDVVRGTDISSVDEYRFRYADGSYKDVYDRGYVIRDAHGKATRMIGAMLDITDRKRLEAELSQAHARLQLAIRGSNISIWEHDMPDGILEHGRMSIISPMQPTNDKPASHRLRQRTGPRASRGPGATATDVCHPSARHGHGI